MHFCRDFVPLKIDGSEVTDEVKATWDKYGVNGLPTVLFLTPEEVRGMLRDIGSGRVNE